MPSYAKQLPGGGALPSLNFNDLFRRQGFEYDNVFDWTILEFQRLEAESEAQQPLAPDGVGESPNIKRYYGLIPGMVRGASFGILALCVSVLRYKLGRLVQTVWRVE